MTASASTTDLFASKRRYLALWFPFLPADRLRRETPADCARPADAPLVFVEKIGGALKLVHCNQAAARLGLVSGLTRADALARIPELAVVDADHQADAEFLTRLADFFDRVSPLVCLDAPHGVMIDITGCAHLFGGEVALRARLKSWAERAGLALRSAIAGTPDAARAMVRFGSPGISAPGADEAKARLLPVAALEASDEAHLALSRAGLKCLADLADRPSKALAARFGQGLVVKLRRILGLEDRRISPLRPLPACSTAIHFPEPLLDLTALTIALGTLIERTVEMLEERGEGGRALEASFFRTDGAVRRVRVETARPSRNAASLVRLFQERMETLADPIDPGFGFDIVRLSVLTAERHDQAQPDLENGVTSEEAVSDLLDRLVVRLGRDRVLRFAEGDTHNPVRAAQPVAAAEAGLSGKAWTAPDGAEPPSRPIQFFEPPQPIEAGLFDIPDGPPKNFRWRRVLHVIAHAEGPERIASEWWRSDGASETHDYYRVEDMEGRRFWIFRAGLYGRETNSPRWFLRGLFA